jgi:hypothetical protein
VHFRLESAQGNWMSIMISPRLEADGGDGMLEGDGVAVFYDAVTQTWMVEDQYGIKDRGVPVRDTHQDLLNTVVWQPVAKKSLIATWSRRLVTGDVAQDKPIAVGAQGNAITWAVGIAPIYNLVSAHLGMDEGGCGYATLVVLGAPDSMTRAIAVPMGVFLGVLGAVIIALAVIHHAPGVGEWRFVRWLLYGRWVPWPKAPAAADWASLGVLPMLRSHTHGQNLVFALYVGANAVLVVMAHARYAAVAATVAPAPSRFPYVLGYLSSLHLALAMLPANRNSFFLRACGVPFERALHWHKIVRYARARACGRSKRVQ